MVSKGILITIEGVSGTGKTTFGKFLCSLFQKTGYNVKFVGDYESKKDSLLTKALLDLLKRDRFLRIGWERESALLIAEFLETIEEEVEPGLNEGCVVIFENYCDAIIAYQAARLRENKHYTQFSEDRLLKYTKKVFFPFFKNIPKPDYIIFLTCSQSIIKKRLEQRDKKAYTEKDEKLQRFTEELYEKILLNKLFLRVNTTEITELEQNKIVRQIYNKILKGLKCAHVNLSI